MRAVDGAPTDHARPSPQVTPLRPTRPRTPNRALSAVRPTRARGPTGSSTQRRGGETTPPPIPAPGTDPIQAARAPSRHSPPSSRQCAPPTDRRPIRRSHRRAADNAHPRRTADRPRTPITAGHRLATHTPSHTQPRIVCCPADEGVKADGIELSTGAGHRPAPPFLPRAQIPSKRHVHQAGDAVGAQQTMHTPDEPPTDHARPSPQVTGLRPTRPRTPDRALSAVRPTRARGPTLRSNIARRSALYSAAPIDRPRIQ